MAFKMNSTTVFNDSAQVDWAIISHRPANFVSSLIKTNFGDGTATGGNPFAANVAYHSGNNTLQIWFNTNCACNCACDCGGGDGGDG